MNDKYIYQGALDQRVFGALPAGDYTFKIADVQPPYFKNEHWILTCKFIIEPSGHTVFYRPWSGTDRNGEPRDQIADLLVAVNHVPPVGTEPRWTDLIGARGRCRLKVKKAEAGALAGQDVNEVHWIHRPHQLESELAQTQQTKTKPSVDPDLDQEPDDIPF